VAQFGEAIHVLGQHLSKIVDDLVDVEVDDGEIA